MLHVRVNYATGRSVDLDVDKEILMSDFIELAHMIDESPIVSVEFVA